MGSYNIRPKRKPVKKGKGNIIYSYYTGTDIKKFNEKILGIGELNKKSSQIEVIAAIFDLAGFTSFCAHSDPYLFLPKYLNRFIKWLFDTIVNEQTVKNYKRGKLLYSHLPFFAKFMGDGVLLLWDTKNMSQSNICNVIILLSRISRRYAREFLPSIKKETAYPPSKLRCGASMGSVCTLGGGKDYVGACINTASRLQKTSDLTFCFALKGLEFFFDTTSKKTSKLYTTKGWAIRGVGGDELICIRKHEYEQLGTKKQKKFKDL